jgi:hypothetical protein
MIFLTMGKNLLKNDYLNYCLTREPDAVKKEYHKGYQPLNESNIFIGNIFYIR